MANRRALWAKFVSTGARQESSTKALPVHVRGGGFRGVILGIDPSVRGTGLAVLSFATGEPRVQFSTTVKIKPNVSFTGALGGIHRAVASILASFPEIEAAACEETIFVQNIRTAQLMGGARGAALGVIAGKGIFICQLAPKAIKLAATGNGRADKQQVQKMIQSICGLSSPLPEDESDAAAAAYSAVARNMLSGLASAPR